MDSHAYSVFEKQNKQNKNKKSEPYIVFTLQSYETHVIL